MDSRRYRLLGPQGFYFSDVPGQLGGNSKAKIYGRLDCPSALGALAKGGYKSCRVFFADEAAAVSCGYRPCGRCLPDKYRVWKMKHPPSA